MKNWYIVQVIPGNEDKVRTEILRRIEEQNAQDLFGEILIPQIKTQADLNDEQKETFEQLFPGYMLFEMEITPLSFNIVKTTPRVYKLLGGTNPTPVDVKEVERIQSQIKGDIKISKEKISIEKGHEIEIKTGAFAGFSGIISSIDEQRQRLVIMVSIFGRMTPVDVSFDQISI